MRWILMVMSLGVLTGCGGGELGDAVEMCRKEVQSRVTEAAAETDPKAMRASAQTAEDGVITFKSLITYRAGTSDQATQPFTCVVATKDDKGQYAPRVIQVHIDPLGYKRSS